MPVGHVKKRLSVFAKFQLSLAREIEDEGFYKAIGKLCGLPELCPKPSLQDFLSSPTTVYGPPYQLESYPRYYVNAWGREHFNWHDSHSSDDSNTFHIICSEGEVDGDNNGQAAGNSGAQSEAQVALSQFWPKVTEEIRKINNLDLKTQALPLARIKKIMKLDDDVKMISAEAPMLFAKASEIFIHELTLRAWVHTEDNKRRTLQRNDIAMAITKFDQFDFLIDIVPREETKTTKTAGDATVRTTMNPDQVHYYFQLAQQHQAAMNQSNQASGTSVQLVQQPQQVQTVSVTNTEAATSSNAPQQVILQQQAAPAAQQPVQQNAQNAAIQIVQQVMGPNGEIQNIPINLTPQQMQMIRLQIQGNSSQPIVIQAPQTIQHNQSQQLIQVSQQAGGATPVYLSQANNTDAE